MIKSQHFSKVIKLLKPLLERDKDILFAYLYGSTAYDTDIPGADVDLAVYLKTSDMKEYIKKEADLTASLISVLETDKIDLRVLNVLPLVLQYSILKEGVLVFSRDEIQRAEFDANVMMRFFDLRPYLEEYRLMLSQKIKGA